MSNKWITGGSSDVGGILRKPNNVPQTVESRGSDLLVFGYACKIFRDDEKALYIDQGKHLIPWMGDNSLKIDRYDVRATLPDLTQYEPPPGGYMNRLEYLSPAEQKAEQLCEEERYYSLHHNEEEEQMYQEEELKRLHQEASSTYGQVAFDYNAEQSAIKEEQEEAKPEEPDEVYTAPANLNLPTGIDTPETMKQHAIIEKTAKFISTQGAQMEILIKAKQSNNPQFEFLNQNNRLNPYYKYILQAFKEGTYPSEDKSDQGETPNNLNYGSGNLNYQTNSVPVHSSFARPPVPVPIIKYKPSANCAYTQLISKIKGVPLPPEQPVEAKEEKPIVPTLLDYNSYYVPQYNTAACEGAYNNTANAQNSQQGESVEQANTDGGVQVNKISTGLMLAQCYASDTEDESEQHSETDTTQPVLNIPIPPDYLQHIIDKTAAYVAKNGKQFEDTLRNKQDDRFLFLDPSNEYHAYYMYKVTGVVHPYPTTNGTQSDMKPKVTMPVSFSIKAKDDYSVPLKPALPQETSDDESEANKTNQTAAGPASQFSHTTVPEHVQRAIQLVEKQLIVKGAQFAQHANNAGPLTAGSSQRSRFDVDNTGAIVNRLNPVPSVPVKTEILQQKELKRAEEKVKDRLAQIAREKLGLISKEKQLQLERKKKAMAFLTQIKSSGIPLPGSAPDESSKGDEDSDSDSGKSSVHSIPISVNDEKSVTSESPEKSETPVTEVDMTKRRSRSTSRSKDKIHKRKKKSKHHSKKKAKKKSRSRSRSRPRNRSRSRSLSGDRKRRKRSTSRKSKKKRRE